MTTSELDSRNIAISMRKSVENLVISSQDAIGQSISQALTFSGVISQHANQIIQENRSVSRSPSPSLRTSDGPDAIENDKVSETQIGPVSASFSGAAVDSISVSSGSDGILATITNKTDNPKATPNAIRASEVRTKKKSWYNSLYPTYKSKSEDFKRLFKDLPDDERLIVDYSCALQKDILAHGRLYASQNYLCFYASIFGWETSLTLRWKDVTAITKEKTALVIPNAILVCADNEKNFLTSFSGRDKAYLMLFRIWQNALMDQPMSSQAIWQWVHSCYGEELGFNSDEEGYCRDLPVEVQPPLDVVGELELGDSSMEAGGEDSRSVSRARDTSPLRVSNGAVRLSGGGPRADADPLPTDMSDTTDSDEKHPDADKCTCSHEGVVLLRQQFPFNVDTMFTMLFTNSKFSLELLAARGARDYVQAQWQPAGEVKCRQVSYVLGLTSGPLGPKEVHVTETQMMNACSCPGVLYSISSVSENAGIPYADYFTADVHYCITRATDHAAVLAMYGHITYKKTPWGMVKSFLEKNAMNGISEYARLVEARLGAEADAALPHPHRKARKLRRPQASSQETAVPSMKVPAVGWNQCWSALLEKHTKRQRGELLAWRDALDHTIEHLHQTEKALRNLLETIEPSLAKAHEESNEPDTREEEQIGKKQEL